MIPKRYEVFYDIEFIDDMIICERKKNKRVVNILKSCISKIPVIDELVLLTHILNVLDEHNIAISRKEVRTALNRHYNVDYHGNKKRYLDFLYKNFKVKKGTITNPQNSRKGSITVTKDPKNPIYPQEKNKTLQNPYPDIRNIKLGDEND